VLASVLTVETYFDYLISNWTVHLGPTKGLIMNIKRLAANREPSYSTRVTRTDLEASESQCGVAVRLNLGVDVAAHVQQELDGG
jgi:hypothetical protein